MSFPPDLQIAQAASLKPLGDVAAAMGIGTHLLEAYGENVAKIKLSAVEELADRPKAKYVVVSAVTPTPLGEGKTTTTVGLGQAQAFVGGQGRPDLVPFQTKHSRKCIGHAHVVIDYQDARSAFRFACGRVHRGHYVVYSAPLDAGCDTYR